jgi:hypothetical protein
LITYLIDNYPVDNTVRLLIADEPDGPIEYVNELKSLILVTNTPFETDHLLVDMKSIHFTSTFGNDPNFTQEMLDYHAVEFVEYINSY